MANILSTELIIGDTNCYKFMKVHETEEDQAVSLENKSRSVLSLLNTIDTIKINTEFKYKNLPQIFSINILQVLCRFKVIELIIKNLEGFTQWELVSLEINLI